MFSSSDPTQTLMMNRLNRIAPTLRTLGYSTKEDYQTAVYSLVNGVLNLGNTMQPPKPMGSEGPTIVGDVSVNTAQLNQDARDIASEVIAMENEAAQIYNLAAASLNQIKQQVRETIYTCTSTRYIEDFVNTKNISSSSTANVDCNTGVATLPVLNTTEVSPVVSIGSNSVGSPVTAISNLTDGQVQTAFTWSGSNLELLLTFPSSNIINRLVLAPDEYDGMEITTIVTSPDGTLYQDVLLDISQDSILLDGICGKYSGVLILDFPPRHTSTMKIVIKDTSGEGIISLRSLSIYQLQYDTSAVFVGSRMSSPIGTVNFTTQQLDWSPMVSLSHQISYDSSTYIPIIPNTQITIPNGNFWYRCIMNLNSTAFNMSSQTINSNVLDPAYSANYSLSNTTYIPLGNGTSQRVLTFSYVSGPIPIRETPLPGTLQITVGSVYLTSGYTFANQVLTLSGTQSNVTVSYITSSLDSASISDLKDYYSPILQEVKFEKA